MNTFDEWLQDEGFNKWLENRSTSAFGGLPKASDDLLDKYKVGQLSDAPTPTGRHGSMWSIRQGLVAVEDGQGGATLYTHKSDGGPHGASYVTPGTTEKGERLSPEEFEQLLARTQSRRKMTDKGVWSIERFKPDNVFRARR